MQVFDHGLIVLLTSRVLIFQNRAGAPGKSGEKQYQIVFQVMQRLARYFERIRFYAVIGKKTETVDPSIGRDVLILFAYRFVKAVDLDFTGLGSQFGRMHETLFVGVQRLQQRGSEAARGSQTGP